MKLYALRHTRTGKLMPLRSSGKGYTWWEPSQLADGAIHVPRLFTAKRSASLARSWWVKGGADIEYVGDFDDIVPEPRIVCKPMGRTEHDMEVVEIGLEVAA